jgi:hypothetical protein
LVPVWPGRIAVAIAAVVAGLLVWWATAPWGPGLSPDAIAYSAIAESIRDRAELGYWLEPRVSSWPPLFPAVLAGTAAILDITVVEAGRIVNAVLQGATVVVTALLARRLLRERWLRAVAVAFAVVAQPLMYVAVKVWSEPLFNVLILAAALALADVGRRRAVLPVMVASGLVVAAFLTRYAGLVFIPAGLLALALWPRSLPRGQRVRRAVLFATPALTAALVLVVWNRARTGKVFGPRWQPDEPFWNHAFDGLAAVGRWWLPSGSTRVVAIGTGVMLLLAACTAVALAWRGGALATGRLPDDDQDEVVGVVPVLGVFVLSYFGYMVWARTTSGFDPLSSRLMLPLLLPGALIVLWLVERLASTRVTATSRNVVLALPLVVLAPAVIAGFGEARSVRDAGNEYTNAAVREFTSSPILDKIPSECSLVSNDPWLLWLTDREAQLTPERVRELAIPPSMSLDDLARLAATSDVCLVWLNTGSTVFYEPDALQAVVGVEQIATDGFTTIYRLPPRS